MAEPISKQAAEYWDENREKSNDPAFWMAHPLCREAINSRVTGSPDEWPLDWFRRVHIREPFLRAVSFGCGLGAFERSAIRCGLALEIDAFDISARSLEQAREAARREGHHCIAYRIGDFDDPRLLFQRYDVAFFHASLHHVSELERLFRRLAFTLKPGGAIYFDEFVGPSRDGWSEGKLEFAQSLLDLLPPEAKVRDGSQRRSRRTTLRKPFVPRKSQNSSIASSRPSPGGPTAARSSIFFFPAFERNGFAYRPAPRQSVRFSQSRIARSSGILGNRITSSRTGG